MPIEHLPMRWRPAARRVRQWAMTDSMAALILGVGMLLRGCSYIPGILGAPPTGGSHPAEGTLPISAWGWVWITTGTACVVLAFVRAPRCEAIFLSIGVGLHVLWACSFLTAALSGESPRGWVSSLSYFMVAFLALWAIWRGKRGDAPMERDYKGGGE
ncbi:hypothetical protein [Corynebacterium pseudopelargi]|uniref:Uncharacterized protein n=1 Tax=Corynebacterium pseudopelargi TaxID=2080757 RepID=A0A3G6IT27_9CORY|nr:hypothetical protein [Corynebacterium pseudopelargi]AZA08687.1 hypothetical protein CPPEL_02780 [Corynebacterium pseudopelargi]